VGGGPPSALERPAVGQRTIVTGHFLEWGLTDSELVGEHAKSPIVDLLVVLATLDHLEREVVKGAAKGGAAVARCVDAPAKVANLELAVDAQEEVLRFYGSEDDVFRGESVSHLINVDRAATFRKGTVLCELPVNVRLPNASIPRLLSDPKTCGERL
jgi:hypothetical protein